MKALLPVYCRPLGYFVIALALFLPFLMMLTGRVTDANLLFYKECSKLLMMLGALMILFALTKGRMQGDRGDTQQSHAQCDVPYRALYFRRHAVQGGAGRYYVRRFFFFPDIPDYERPLP